MQVTDSAKKRVFLAEMRKQKWLNRPASIWPKKRYFLFHVDEISREVEVISEFADEDDIFNLISENNYEVISGEGEIEHSINQSENEDEDFAHEITKAILRDLDRAIIEVVIIRRDGRPSPRQPLSRFWVISLSGGQFISAHISLRSAYARVSDEHENALRKKYAAPRAAPGVSR